MEKAEATWTLGPIELPAKNGHIFIFDRLKALNEGQLAELFKTFDLPRNPGMPRTEEEFVLAACLQHRLQTEVNGGATEKVEACRTTYVDRYRQMIVKLEKGEPLPMSKKKEKKARTPKEKKEAGPRGKMYEVSSRVPAEDAFGAQAKIVYEAIKKVGPAQPETIVKEVEDGGALKTKQGATKVVAFYLAQFKKSGYVKTSDPA